ncbi:hypothetical protein ACU8KH_04313 [Lachancea thermotolerans]
MGIYALLLASNGTRNSRKETAALGQSASLEKLFAFLVPAAFDFRVRAGTTASAITCVMPNQCSADLGVR